MVRARILESQRQERAKDRPLNRPCIECGQSFIYQPKFGGNSGRFCSSECRESRKSKTHNAWCLAHQNEQKQKYAAYRRKFKEQDPDYFKRHYAANRERKKRQSQEWYRENAEYALGRQKAYASKRLVENPDHVRAIGRKHAQSRRAIKKQVFVENVDPRVVFKRDKGICGICLKTVDPTSKWEVDHKIPISKGGAHSYANVQLSHRKCNRAKWANLPKGQPTLFQVIAS